MTLYPVMVNIENRPVAMIGGGNVALRKTRDLLEAGARVTVIAPEIQERFSDLVKEYGDRIALIEKEYKSGSLENYSLVFSAANNAEVNAAVYAEAHSKNIFINIADDPSHCSFFIPSFIRKGDLVLALSTSGSSPAYAARLRRMLEENIPEKIELILSALAEIREILKSDKDFSSLDTKKRGELLRRIANDDKLLDGLLSASAENKLPEFLIKLTGVFRGSPAPVGGVE
jgi:siroheme synthase-like protein